jgi:hypothetical protein
MPLDTNSYLILVLFITQLAHIAGYVISKTKSSKCCNSEWVANDDNVALPAEPAVIPPVKE